MDLRSTARDRGLKQRIIAERLGVSETAVSVWFSRTVDIPTRYIAPLAEILGLPPADVLTVAVARTVADEAEARAA